jgi:hypothetical protein
MSNDPKFSLTHVGDQFFWAIRKKNVIRSMDIVDQMTKSFLIA